MTGQTDRFCNFCIFSKFPGNRQNTSKTAVFDNKTVAINPKERAHNVRPAENHPFTVILHFPFSILYYFHFHSRTSGISSPYSVIYC